MLLTPRPTLPSFNSTAVCSRKLYEENTSNSGRKHHTYVSLSDLTRQIRILCHPLVKFLFSKGGCSMTMFLYLSVVADSPASFVDESLFTKGHRRRQIVRYWDFLRVLGLGIAREITSALTVLRRNPTSDNLLREPFSRSFLILREDLVGNFYCGNPAEGHKQYSSTI